MGVASTLEFGNPFARTSNTDVYQSATVTRASVETTVTATRPVTSVAGVPLTLKTSGKLAKIDVAVGDTRRTTQASPLGGYLREILTGQKLPSDLANATTTSPRHSQNTVALVDACVLDLA